MDGIEINIDCYNCGSKLTFVYRLYAGSNDHEYCSECQQGIRLFFDGTMLEIEKVEPE